MHAIIVQNRMESHPRICPQLGTEWRTRKCQVSGLYSPCKLEPVTQSHTKTFSDNLSRSLKQQKIKILFQMNCYFKSLKLYSCIYPSGNNPFRKPGGLRILNNDLSHVEIV